MGARGRRHHSRCADAAAERDSPSSLSAPSARAVALATASAFPPTTSRCTASAAQQPSHTSSVQPCATFSKSGRCVTKGCSHASRPSSVWCAGCWRKQAALFLQSSPPPMPAGGRARSMSLLQPQNKQQQQQQQCQCQRQQQAFFRRSSATAVPAHPLVCVNNSCKNKNKNNSINIIDNNNSNNHSVCTAIPCEAELMLRNPASPVAPAMASPQWCRGGGSPPRDPRSLTVINLSFANLLVPMTPSDGNDMVTTDATTLSPVVSSSSGAEDSFSDASADRSFDGDCDGDGRKSGSSSSDEDSELLDQALSDLASDEDGDLAWAESRREVVFETIRKAASAVVAPHVRIRARSQHDVVSPARRRKHRVWSVPQA